MSEKRVRYKLHVWPADEVDRDQLTRRALEDAKSDSLPKFLPHHALAHLAAATEELIDATSAAAHGSVTSGTLTRLRRVAKILSRLKAMGLKIPEMPG